MRKPWLGFLLMAILPITGQAQSMSSTSSGSWGSASWVSSFTDCASVNCWWLSSGLGPRINASYGGHIVKLDSSGCASIYNNTANTWAAQTSWGCGLQKVLYGGDGNIYALTGPCNGVQYGIFKRVGNSWVQTPGCGADFSLDPMGGNMSVNIDPGGGLWASTNYLVSSTNIHGCLENGHGWSISVAMLSSLTKTFYVVCNDHTMWKGVWNGTDSGVTYTQLPSAGVMIAAAYKSVYILGTDSHAYHLKTNGQWEGIISYTFTYLSVGDDMNIWAVGPTVNGHNDYRFSENSLQFVRNYSGTVSCASGVPPSLCSTFTHSTGAQIGFGKSAVGHTVSSTPWNGAGQWGLSPTVVAHPNDLFQCLLNADPSDCYLAENSGEMTCSGGGSNSDNAPTVSIKKEWARSHMRRNSGPPQLDGDFYVYSTSPECSNTASPDLNPGGVASTDTLSPTAFDVQGMCFSIDHIPWVCKSAGFYAAVNYDANNPDPGPMPCTANTP